MGDHFTAAVADKGTILLAEVGSTAQGTNIDSTDTDLYGICIESPGILIGSRTFEQHTDRRDMYGHPIPKDERTPPGGVDKNVFGLRKWTAQAVKGNPSALLPLFVPEDKLHIITYHGYQLRGQKDLFLSKQCAFAFRGYLKRQQANAFSDAKHTNRPELVAKYGYDTKAAYHALRLALQGRELVTDRTITLPIEGKWCDFLIDVRKGEHSLEDVQLVLATLIRDMEEAVDISDLPDRVDMSEVDAWMVHMYKTYWKAQGWV